MPGENEFYAAEKVARKIIKEEMEKCLMGNTHAIEIKNMKGDIENMKKDYTSTSEAIFQKLDGINNKFLTMAVSAVLQLVGFIGALVLLYLTTRTQGGG